MITAYIVTVPLSGSNSLRGTGRKKISWRNLKPENSHALNPGVMTSAITGKRMMRKMKIGRNKIVLATSFHVFAYLILMVTLFTRNAVALVILVPTGLACVFLGVALWLLSVWTEAREKKLL